MVLELLPDKISDTAVGLRGGQGFVPYWIDVNFTIPTTVSIENIKRVDLIYDIENGYGEGQVFFYYNNRYLLFGINTDYKSGYHVENITSKFKQAAMGEPSKSFSIRITPDITRAGRCRRGEIACGNFNINFTPNFSIEIETVEVPIPPPPVLLANFSYTVPKPQIVQFKNESSGADSFAWNFGDGEVSIERNPKHIYVVGGNYMVALTVYAGGFSDSIHMEVNSGIRKILPPPPGEVEPEKKTSVLPWLAIFSTISGIAYKVRGK